MVCFELIEKNYKILSEAHNNQEVSDIKNINAIYQVEKQNLKNKTRQNDFIYYT